MSQPNACLRLRASMLRCEGTAYFVQPYGCATCILNNHLDSYHQYRYNLRFCTPWVVSEILRIVGSKTCDRTWIDGMIDKFSDHLLRVMAPLCAREHNYKFAFDVKTTLCCSGLFLQATLQYMIFQKPLNFGHKT